MNLILIAVSVVLAIVAVKQYRKAGSLQEQLDDSQLEVELLNKELGKKAAADPLAKAKQYKVGC